MQFVIDVLKEVHNYRNQDQIKTKEAVANSR
jgi:hypothetical protein